MKNWKVVKKGNWSVQRYVGPCLCKNYMGCKKRALILEDRIDLDNNYGTRDDIENLENIPLCEKHAKMYLDGEIDLTNKMEKKK